MSTDSESSSSDAESDGFDSADESKLIKKYTRKHGERNHVGKSNRAKHGSSYLRLTTQGVDQFASTPSSIFDELCARWCPAFGLKTLFDPCPEFYDKKTGGRINKPGYDGLKEDWGKVSYVNPPYGQIKKWFPKAVEQQAKGNTSIFLVPLRPFTAYFVETSPHISWSEVIYYGVGFKGYSGKIPHPMCCLVFLGKGVKDREEFHMTVPQVKKIHNFAGSKELTVKMPCRRHTYVQKVPKPCAFDNATEICRNHGIPESRIHIMINSSNMVDAGWLDKERISKARKNWKNSYALLVPFYNYSVAFQIGMREATILAYSSPILSNYAGEGKCRFCSVLFVFCPTSHKNFKAIVAQPNLHPFKMYFNYNGYLPTIEELDAAKRKKIQKTKARHMAAQRGVMKRQGRSMAGGKVTSNVRSKSAKAKKKSAKKSLKKNPAKKSVKKSLRKAVARKAASNGRAKKTDKKQTKAAKVTLDKGWKGLPVGEDRDRIILKWARGFTARNGRLPRSQDVAHHFGRKQLDFTHKKMLFYMLDLVMATKKQHSTRKSLKALKSIRKRGAKRRNTSVDSRPAKRQKLSRTAGSKPQSG